MRNLTLFAFVAISHVSTAAANDRNLPELNQWHPLEAKYKIHSGGTAYSELPTKTDSALSIALKGEQARQIFEQIGPDVAPVCSDEKGDRLREKKGIYCSYTARLDNPENSHYRCWIGINLRTGEGDVRISC